MTFYEIKSKYISDGFSVPKNALKQSFLKKMDKRIARANSVVRELQRIRLEMEKTSDLSVCRNLEMKAYELQDR